MAAPEEVPDLALITVADKTGIEEFAQGLHELDWEIYASSGTVAKLKEAAVPVIDVANLVGGKAILGHRVVTLSREISAGVLADDTPEDTEELLSLGIPRIGLVCVDMYPLQQEVRNPSATLDSVREKTDIGGPTLLRAAAKAHRIVLSKTEQRPLVLNWLRDGRPDEDHVLRILAATAETVVEEYVGASADYLRRDALRRADTIKHAKNSYARKLAELAF